PSASMRRSVGLRAGPPEAVSERVTSALHRRRILQREPQTARIHTRFPAYLTGRAAVLIWGSHFIAFSSEVDPGSREENASKQEAGTDFRPKPPDPEPCMDNTMPILLVPGLVSSPRIFGPLLPALWRLGPVTVANHIRDDNMGAIARRILAEAPPRFALAGHSMGGSIAFEIMRQAPQRVARLALINNQARPGTAEAPTRATGMR